MNISRIDAQFFNRPFESAPDLARQANLVQKATQIILGLSLVTTGNALAIATQLDNDPASKIDSEQSIELSSLHSSATPTLTSKPVAESELIVSGLKPAPSKDLESPAPKPSLTAAPTPAAGPTTVLTKPSANSLRIAPKAALKKPEAPVSEVRPMSELTRSNIEAMKLSQEGYRQFLNTVDTSHFDYAQQFVPFDPNRVNVHQGKSEFFTLHFTALYSNGDGISTTDAEGSMDPRKLIKSMGERHSVCCGINWLLGRDGQVYQTAPINAKLRHNPPYDSINTGVEVESKDQDSITPKQYESLVYLTLAVLKQQKLIDQPLAQTVHGHGEDRDAYRANNPNSKWGMRNDFDKPVASFFRAKIEQFLAQNPTILELEPAFK